MPDVVEQRDERSRPRVFIGIDPGASGGVAVITEGTVLVRADVCDMVELPPLLCWKMPDTHRELWRQLSRFSNTPVFACVELVGGWVGSHGRGEGDDGTQSNPGSAMFTFGESYGAICMALVAAKIQHEAVRPQAWQKTLGLHKVDSAGFKWKAYLKHRAAELFPSLKVTNKTADALLIAEHCRRKWGAA